MVTPVGANRILGSRLRGIWGQFLPAFLLWMAIRFTVGREFAWAEHSVQSEGYGLAAARVSAHLSLSGRCKLPETPAVSRARRLRT